MSSDDDRQRVAPWVQNAVVLIVSLVWAAAFLAPIFVPTYKPRAEINFAFAAIVGGSLGYRILTKER